LPSNATHLERAIRQALALPPGRLGVFGLAFKENTDDLRESAVVQLLAALLAAGRQVRVYDPHVRLGAIYGSNARYLVESIPPIGSLLEDHLDHLVEWAEHIVLAQKPAPEMLARLRESGKTVLDLVGARE
jgi:GDP-mannose 6-dehydrogenase